MNNYYVSAARGSDSTGAGTALNPWKTITKAIGPPAGASLGANGARVYIEPGTYYEVVTLGLTPTASARLEIVGDCDGAGFASGGYATPTIGIVDWSGWSNDSMALGTPCLAGGGKSYVAVRRIKMHGALSSNSCIDVGSGREWTITDCILVPHTGYTAISIGSATAPATAGANATIERCDFYHGGNNAGRSVRLQVAEAAAEYSINSVIRNCRAWGGSGLALAKAASTGLGALATGLQVSYCSFFGPNGLSIYAGEPISLSFPISVVGCIIHGNVGITAGNASHVAENYNAFHCMNGARQNVSPGANSSTNLRPALDFGDGRLVGTPLRPPGEPVARSPLAGGVGSGAFPATDFTGRARPEGYLSTRPVMGALERHDTGEMNTSYADSGSGACLALRGPSSLERPILVDPTATVVRVKVRWDGNHGDANRPQAVLLANPEIGVMADQTVTASSAGGTGTIPNDYETLSFAPVTPTRPGALMLRLVSRSSTGTGIAYFDSITLS